MGEYVSNELKIGDGPLGSVELSDGSGKITSSPMLTFNMKTGTLTSNSFLGDGGNLSNIAMTDPSGVPGQVAYFSNGQYKLVGDSGLTYLNSKLALTGDLTVSGDFTVGGNTYVSNNVIFNDPIIQLGNSSPVNTTLGTVLSRPGGNVMMAYLSSENTSAYMNTLVFGYTFGSANGTLLPVDTSNNLDVRVVGNLTADYYTGNASHMTGTTSATTGSYGTATKIPQITVDSNGRITSISNVVVDPTFLTLQQVSDTGNTTSNTIQFTNSGISFLTSGKVGISNSNPSNLLSVGQNTWVSSNLIFTSGNVMATSYLGNASQLVSTTGASAGTYGSTSQIPNITIDSNGRLTSISTSTIATTLQAVSDNGNTTSNTIQFTNSGISFLTSGKVGIANSNPSNLLSVGQNTWVSANLIYTSGNIMATSYLGDASQLVGTTGATAGT
jgi:hypothetical protein